MTGIKTIDILFPIGLGQRQLIIGDRNTGKTAIAVDSIISQRKTRLKCIYVSIGQKKSLVNSIIRTLKKTESYHFTTIVSADSADAVALQFLAPYTGCALAEVFSSLGGDSLIIYDDLSKHAVAYRQMALILRKSPGREAFPSDIFYLHSNLLERSGQFFSGSLTALPIVETQSRDVSAFIPTNIISITDGQVFLDASYFNRGFLPAINTGLSVSRIGSKAQIPCLSYMAKWVKISMSDYNDLESLISFSDDLDSHTSFRINRGSRIGKFLTQEQNEPVDFFDQIMTLGVAYKGALYAIPVNDTTIFIENVTN